MDVYHSVGRQRKSFLSFVSTEDEFFSKYQTQSLEMEMGNEFSFSLCPVLEKAIESFVNEGRAPVPQRVIVFRDGISNSQAKVVIESEVAQFRQALENAQ